MKKKLLDVRGAKRRFNKFEHAAGLLGFVRISSQRESRDHKMIGLIPPDSPRIDDLAHQVILKKEVNGLVASAITTYDPFESSFTRAGKFYIVIALPDDKGKRGKILFLWKTTRTWGFLDRALEMLKLVNNALEKRPLDEQRQLMKLQSQVGISRLSPYTWVGKTENGHRMQKPFMVPLGGNSKSNAFLSRWLRDVWYYEKVRRIDMGYKRREREVRKPYTVKKK